MYLYLYIACTGYWKTNFNSQDWLIESFLNKKKSLNYFFQVGMVQYDWFCVVQIFLFLPKVTVIDGFIQKFI